MFDKVAIFVILCVFTIFLKKITSAGHNKIKFKFYFLTFYFMSSLVSAIIWPIFLLKPRDVWNAKFGANLIKYSVNWIYDIKWILRNGEILSEDRGAVIVANHQSSLDILGMFNIWSIADKISAIAKKEILYVFPFGLVAYLAGVVFISRNNKHLAYKEMEHARQIMVNKKTKIWIFPEGTRNKDYTKLLPFKKGAFNIAVTSQVPIIPVVFSPYYFVNHKKHIFDKGNIIMQCLDPIPTNGLTVDDVPQLMKEVHDKMSATYKELSKEIYNSLPADYPFTLEG